MNILIIGSGGREHALLWKLHQSPRVKKIYVASGNGGTVLLGENISIKTVDEICNWVKNNNVDLVVIGPDSYLEAGLADRVAELGIAVFGPTRNASQIEWSKSYAKTLMEEEGIPTAKCRTFTDVSKAKEYLTSQNFPIVIKADGLASGKGVIIAQNNDEGESAIDEIMSKKAFGTAGDTVIIEEYLRGLEISTHAFCDGTNACMFPSSKDHKRIFDEDVGPNTGGMGTVSPVPSVTDEQLQEIKERIIIPTLKALKKKGRKFKGILFPGIILTNDGPKVIEFNARFGDPETQVYMRLLETDLVDILLACVNEKLDEIEIKWSSKSSACIVLASEGYPGKYLTGTEILGLENHNENIEVFHGGTVLEGGKVATIGGRVLGVTSVGENLSTALKNAYNAVEQIKFEGMQYRNDIGKSVL